MPTVEARVNDLEFYLAEAMRLQNELRESQLKTESEIRDLKTEMAGFKTEMSEFKSEMADFKNEMSEFKNEMLEFKNEMLEFKVEMSEFKDEMRASVKRMDKAWGDLANKLGTIIEDIVAPNIRRLAVERFGCEPLERFLVRANVRRPNGRWMEFDVIASGAGNVVLAESKSTITADAVAKFQEKIGAFFDFFPELRGQSLVPIIASWNVPDIAREALTAAHIYGLEMGEETMRLVNDGEF
jgi:predicted RNase H-like nuclease (RuvC/YqgF family)